MAVLMLVALPALSLGVRLFAGVVSLVARVFAGVFAGLTHALEGLLAERWVGWVLLVLVAHTARRWWRRHRRRVRRDATPGEASAPRRESVEPTTAQESQDPRAPSSARPLAALVSRTAAWLAAQRSELPQPAHAHLDSVLRQLDALAAQLTRAAADEPASHELQHLLVDELPALIAAYRKVPETLRSRALYGGSTAEQQLVAGLVTIDQQLGRLHEQLAAEVLKALAAHQRFLHLKYRSSDGLG